MDVAGGRHFLPRRAGLYFAVSLYQLVFGSENDFARLSDAFFYANKILAFAVFWPQCLLYSWVAAWLIIKAISEWHGNINRRLLLKLLEAQQTQAPGPGKAS